MLIKFLKHTGAARDGQPGDPDARLAIDYLQGEMVLKPERAGGPKVWTRRATAPIPISGHAWLISQTCAALPSPCPRPGSALGVSCLTTATPP